MRGRIVLQVGAGIGAAVCALSGTMGVGATGGGGPVAASVLGSGSDTTQFMMQALDGLYLFSPGCAQIPTPSGPTPWLDFSCQASDPTGTVTTENYEHDQVHEAYFLGSSNGVKQLCEQGLAGVAPIDFARSSRTFKAGDCSGLHFIAYARDAISWEAFNIPGSGINNGGALMSNTSGLCAGSPGTANKFCLTQQQIKYIWLGGDPADSGNPGGCPLSWSEFGGANVPIDPYTPQPGSGTRSTWDTFLGASSDACINARGTTYANSHIVPENSNVSVVANGDQVNAIFPFSFGVYSTQVKGKGGSLLGAVDKILPNATTIGNLKFPYGRYLYNVTCPTGCTGAVQATQATLNYVGETGWICKLATAHAVNPVTGNNYATDIQNAIKSTGFVPLPSGAIGGGATGSDYCRLSVSP